MATSTIEVQALRVLRFPLMGMATGLVVISLLALDFRIDVLHIVSATVLLAVALFFRISFRCYRGNGSCDHNAKAY